MQPYIVGLPEAPKGFFFNLKDTSYSPEVPRLEEPFIIKGKITLFGIPFLLPLWVMATVTYPETWWEEIIPIIGAPRVREVIMATGGDFEITFPEGFLREGEYELVIYTYLGPTAALDSIILPPAPSIASYKGLFTVSGAAPPIEETFQEFRILGYSKGAGDMVTPDNPLELNAGDACRVHIGFSHKGVALNEEFYVGLWQATLLDPHNMMAVAKKTFNIPMSADWEPYQNYIDIPTTDLDPGDYGLYAKENKLLPKLQVFLPEGVIKIAGIAPTEWILVEEVSGIVVEAGPEVAIWQMVEEISGIVVEAAPPVAGWQMVEEVSGIVVEAALPPAKEPPEIETLSATNITHNSVTLSAELIDEGFCSGSYCYIEFGKTTSYGNKSAESRLQPGQTLNVDIGGLTPDTTYHFRAVAEGRCVTPILKGYGNDRTFKTAAEVVKGFQMRVINPPSGAVYWAAGCVLGGNYPYMTNLEPLSYVWKWTKAVPGITLRFFVVASGAEEDGFWPTVQYDEFDFLLRDGKNYVWDFAAHKMSEE